MKISDSQTPSNDPKVNSTSTTSPTNTQNHAPNKEGSPFSKVLAKKREGSQDGAETKGGKPDFKDLANLPPGLMGPVTPFDQSIQPTRLEGKSVAEIPVELQQLVHEISSEVNAAGNHQVNIELNSNVLKGLHIQIEKQSEGIAVRFQSSSDQVAQLLAKNVEALSSGLAERGVNVADIRVAGPQDSSRSQSFKSASNFSGRWQGGRQGGRR